MIDTAFQDAVLCPPHATILVLPKGLVHDGSVVLDGPSSEVFNRIEQARQGARAQAARAGRPVRVSVAHPDGRVDAQLVGEDGAVTVLVRHTQPASGGESAPQWSDGMPPWSGALERVRAAESAGRWPQARAEAERLAADVLGEVGDGHPYVVRAAELQGYLALHAGDLNAASAFYVLAATGRHLLGATGEELERDLHNAAACWLRAGGGAFEAGCAVGHLLARIGPEPSARLAAVLRRLGAVR